MTKTIPDISGLLGSRICHDLISPLGAIANGVELMSLTGETGPEFELISESVRNANARIRFFRVAFGAVSDGQMIGAREVRGVLTDLSAGGKTTIEWLAEEDLPRQEVRLIFLLLMCFETAMPWGGKVVVAREDAGWTVTATSERMKSDGIPWEVLERPETGGDLGPAQVHFLLLPPLLAEMGRGLSLEVGPTKVVARL